MKGHFEKGAWVEDDTWNWDASELYRLSNATRIQDAAFDEINIAIKAVDWNSVSGNSVAPRKYNIDFGDVLIGVCLVEMLIILCVMFIIY